MKLSIYLVFALFSGLLVVAACNSKKEQPVNEQSTVTPDGMSGQDVASMTGTTNGNEPHYKCPNNCEGGGGSAQGKCPICGTDLVHNPAFHAQAPPESGTTPSTPIQVEPINSTSTGTQPVQVQPMQATAADAGSGQNAKGDWHWICSKGCQGGAAAQGNCAKCGNPLTHNQAYHQ